MRNANSVAQMKLFHLQPGQLVQTLGYYVAGDGGGALYLTAANAVVDGYGDHELANGVIALIQDAIKNVLQYGAGTTGDVSPQFLAADTAGVESTYVPVATYDLTSGDFTGLKYHSYGVPTISAGTITILNLVP